MSSTDQITAKVVLLGKNNSGKTCLLERYLHQRYLEYAEATIGAAYGTKTLDIRDKRITMGIWDTAGSERYDAMSRVYYRGAKAAIICYDLTEESSFHRAKYWVNELQTYEEFCNIYLCGTKMDMIQGNNSLRAISSRTVKEYAEKVNAKSFQTSSKTGQGVEGLFFAVAEGCIDLDDTQERGGDKIISFDKELKKSKKKCDSC
ncbi:ras-related protein Rab-24 [Exaiptasia diaphana]|uniref:Ras-related protein Rab-24 n=1 Tax=Exaiptasia diaphana TaxID=2652724 RepID=A0A913Y2V4_EXADI|nr:ras-related protein Rab-24 [Exaiptasia diaphana]